MGGVLKDLPAGHNPAGDTTLAGDSIITGPIGPCGPAFTHVTQ